MLFYLIWFLGTIPGYYMFKRCAISEGIKWDYQNVVFCFFISFLIGWVIVGVLTFLWLVDKFVKLLSKLPDPPKWL